MGKSKKRGIVVVVESGEISAEAVRVYNNLAEVCDEEGLSRTTVYRGLVDDSVLVGGLRLVRLELPISKKKGDVNNFKPKDQ